jgi:hypothetical protein
LPDAAHFFAPKAPSERGSLLPLWLQLKLKKLF